MKIDLKCKKTRILLSLGSTQVEVTLIMLADDDYLTARLHASGGNSTTYEVATQYTD